MSKKTPQIRFKGFTDDWEERKLGDAVNISSGVTGDATLQNGKYRLTRIESISQGMLNVARLGFTNEKPDQKYLLNVGDILYSNINSLSHIGKVALVDTTGIYHGINLLRFQMRNGVDSEFLFQRLNTMPMKNWAVSHANPAVSQASINQTELSKQPILSPTLTEQQQIGSFFKEIDNTIALHQRKLDLLKEQKKGFLQKMFAKNGAKVPELRFAGFADDWEDRKLKDVTERVRSNDGRMDLPTLTMSASSGWLDQKDRFSGDISGKEKKNYTLLKKGELSYNHGNSKLAKYGVVFSLTNYEEALVPRVYHSFKALENTSADFIEYMFSTKLPDRELGKLVSSGARMDGLLNINYDDFMNIHISIPNYEEQILMSAFFRKLDETIALHQRKLDLLKEQKKGFLQKMFVS
ncbi:MAG: restriction endonuclease subunit S [Leuconostoc lactis]|uniref:restriction endonuclease subunit S n=1 Tax=Leuconostoc lactis TaxID=1246 RepID=UPI0039965C54